MDDIVMHGPCETQGCDRPAQVSRGLEDFLCVACSQKQVEAREKERAYEWKTMKQKWADDNNEGALAIRPAGTGASIRDAVAPLGDAPDDTVITTTTAPSNESGTDWVVMPPMPSLVERPEPPADLPDLLPIEPEPQPDQEAEDG